MNMVTVRYIHVWKGHDGTEDVQWIICFKKLNIQRGWHTASIQHLGCGGRQISDFKNSLVFVENFRTASVQSGTLSQNKSFLCMCDLGLGTAAIGSSVSQV